jgi:hypothetical protein
MASLFNRILAVASLIAGSAALAAELHVSPHGDDANPGTAARPLATLQKVFDMLKPGDRCIVHGGTYRQTAVLRASGTADKPIRIMTVPGEVATLSGTELVTSTWSVHRGSVYRTPLPGPVRAVFVDGELMTEARWPNMPFAERWDKSRWRASAKGTDYGTMVDPGLAETGIDWTGAVATLNIGSWQTFRRTVRSHGAGRDRFTYDRDENHRLAKGKPHRPGFDRYFLAGKLEALDSPGEWFHDGRTLYLWTPDGRSPTGHAVEARTRGYALAANGVSHVTVSGFHFFAATLKLEDTRNCTLDGLCLTYPHGVWEPFGEPVGLPRDHEEPRDWASRNWFKETSVVTPTFVGGEGNTIRRCTIRYANGSSIVVAGKKNLIEDCLIHDIDWYGLDTGLAVDMLGTRESTIRHCTVFNMGSSEGLRLSNQGVTIVERNYIHHGGMAQSDGALIQVATPGVAGTTIRYNWVHDHNAFNWGGRGIRGDDKTRGLIVHHNVVWRCREIGIITKGDGNRVLNNTCFANPKIDICLPRNRLPSKTDELEVQNANSQAINNIATTLTGLYDFERRRLKKDLPPHGKVAANAPCRAYAFLGPDRNDYRPYPNSPYVEKGIPVPGITDGFKYQAPDIGAYEFGAPRWVPGYRNALWIYPCAGGISVVLAMPVLSWPRTVRVESQNLTFTSEDWMRPRLVKTDARQLRVAFHDLTLRLTLPRPENPRGLLQPFRTIP